MVTPMRYMSCSPRVSSAMLSRCRYAVSGLTLAKHDSLSPLLAHSQPSPKRSFTWSTLASSPDDVSDRADSLDARFGAGVAPLSGFVFLPGLLCLPLGATGCLSESTESSESE